MDPARPSEDRAEPVIASSAPEPKANAESPMPASSSPTKNGAVEEQPTKKELKDCRHVKNGLSKNVWFVAVLGLCERFAYYGIIVMFRT